MDYYSLSLLNYTSYHLHHHLSFCLATLRNERNRWVIKTWTQVHQNNYPTKRLNDINQTWCQCHPLLLPSHQGPTKQEHSIHQWCKEARGATCICWLFIPGKLKKLNCNVVSLDMWYLTKVWWDISQRRILMGVWMVIWYIEMKNGSNYQEKGSARWGVLCAREEYIEGVGGVWNEKEERQI